MSYQLTVKRSKVVPTEKPNLIGSVWTKKTFNLGSFHAQFKSIWKTKKFEIRLAGQNLFLISFDCGEDLEFVMEGCPWLFRGQLVLLERLTSSMYRDLIWLVHSSSG